MAEVIRGLPIYLLILALVFLPLRFPNTWLGVAGVLGLLCLLAVPARGRR